MTTWYCKARCFDRFDVSIQQTLAEFEGWMDCPEFAYYMFRDGYLNDEFEDALEFKDLQSFKKEMGYSLQDGYGEEIKPDGAIVTGEECWCGIANTKEKACEYYEEACKPQDEIPITINEWDEETVDASTNQ